MNEEQILNAIVNYCQNDRLVFQVIVQDSQAHVYINRVDDWLDYSQLTDNIVAAVSSLENLDLKQIYLYSRRSGEIEPDWQTDIDLNAIDTDTDTNTAIEEDAELEIATDDDNEFNSEDLCLAIEKDEPGIENPSDIPPASESTAQTQVDLSSYCFIRNQRLLSGELVPPKPNIAQLVKAFDEFEETTKQEQLPVLADYFSTSSNPDTANFTPEVETWWPEILALSPEEGRKAAIWFSRYCHDPQATLAIIESVFTAEKAIAKSRQESQESEANQIESETKSLTEYSYIPQKQSDRSRTNERNTVNNIATGKPFKVNLLVPIIWLVVTLFITAADINKPVDAVPVACENLTEQNLDYCLLAAKIVGKEPVDAVVANLPEPLKPEDYLATEAMMNDASINCELQGNIAAGVPLKEATPFKTPVLSASTAEILPDFYVADVEQTNFKEGNPTVRTVCFFYRVNKKIGKRYSIKFLAYDRVDLDWPTVEYEPTERVKSVHTLNKTARTYNFLSLFGVNTLFTAIAIYLIAICGMAIKVDSIETIYQASFILGMTKSILSFIPVFGLFIFIPIECIALGITSGCVKGFNIDWNCGYHFVAVTAMVLIILRMLFTFLFLGFLSSIFG